MGTPAVVPAPTPAPTPDVYVAPGDVETSWVVEAGFAATTQQQNACGDEDFIAGVRMAAANTSTMGYVENIEVIQCDDETGSYGFGSGRRLQDYNVAITYRITVASEADAQTAIEAIELVDAAGYEALLNEHLPSGYSVVVTGTTAPEKSLLTHTTTPAPVTEEDHAHMHAAFGSVAVVLSAAVAFLLQ